MSVDAQPPEDNWDDLFGLLSEEESDLLEEEPEEQEEGFFARLMGRFRRGGRPAEAEPSKEPRRRRGLLAGFTRGQKIVLGLLTLLVLLACLLMGVIVARTLPATAPQPAPGELTVVVPEGTPIVVGQGTVPPEATATLQVTTGEATWPAEDEEGGTPPPDVSPTPPPTFTPTVTPTPAPVVFTQYDAQIQANPDSLELRLLRAETYLQMGAYEAAIADLRHALTLDSKRAETYLDLGRAYYRLCRWKEAEDAFGSAIAFNEDLSEAHFGLGQLLYYEGRYTEAFNEFDWAAEINPDFAEAEAWLAMTAVRLGDLVEATNALSRTLTTEGTLPDLPIMYIARSWVRRTVDPPDLDGAQADLLYAQSLSPYAVQNFVALARFYADYRPERLAEAEQLAHYALDWARDPLDRALSLHVLGRVYLAEGRKEDARRVLAEAGDLATIDGKVVIADLAEDLSRAFAP